MTEQEKMLAGELYDANYNPDLIKQRTQCKELCFDYNHIRPSDFEKREATLRKIFGKLGRNPVIEQPFVCDYGYNISAGDSLYINHNCVILDPAQVTFGDHVFIAPNCCFSTATHPIDPAQRNRGLERALPIRIGNNVWIGANVTVLPGVTIGDNCVIGAGSVVTRDIPANTIAFGNPCRPHRKIDEKK
ncbi:MAG: sugar O-acetyltransferase [Fibrobacter sp.]|nr:sugar O-acetyltransferase [Fibrobacter sp.]